MTPVLNPAAWVAHGVGKREDLPLPFPLVVAGASVALVVSFVALGALWRTPRLHPGGGHPLPATTARLLDSRWLRGGAVALALALSAWTLMALVAGADNANNPTPYVVYVWLWIGLPFLSLVLGPVWRVLNPLRALFLLLCRAGGLDPLNGILRYRLGYWPAAAGLFAFTWLELIAPDRTTRAVLLPTILGVMLLTLLGAVVFGPRWFERADPFEVLSSLYGALSPLGRRPDRTWVVRTPLHGVDRIEADHGLLATVSVLLGGTAYDGFSGLTAWFSWTQSSASPVAAQTLGLLGFCVLVAGTLAAAAGLAARIAGVVSLRGCATAFAPSLVPIAAGYVVAHYWSLWVYGGQLTLALLSDPLGTGANWLGTRGLTPGSALIGPTFVACLQVTAIVTGHVLGIVHAHERALRLFDRKAAVRGQVPMLVVMVGYTCGGLVLLFAA
ncbi:hypothetical protein [Phycicoccus sp. Root101]|uniref:hypothetical protein n=1 Tax=Phycicoccus sp. Root101 TaxID=1736421 RepID=UPI0009E6FA25|nr:hypothetical protein [Phycicoccus sp. Root101]